MANPKKSPPGKKVSKADRDDSKKKVAIGNKNQEQEHALKELKKRQKLWEAQAKGLSRVKRKVDDSIKKGEDRAELDKGVVNLVKKTTEFIKKISKDGGSYSGTLQNSKELDAISTAAGKIPINSMTSFADLTLVLSTLIVLMHRLLKMKVKKKKK